MIDCDDKPGKGEEIGKIIEEGERGGYIVVFGVVALLVCC